MARKPRFAPGGLAYHVMNRTWPGVDLFEDDADYQAVAVAVQDACEYYKRSFHELLWWASIRRQPYEAAKDYLKTNPQ